MQNQPLEQYQREAVQSVVEKLGIWSTAQHLGVTVPTLQRAISGSPLQARTFAQLVSGMLALQALPADSVQGSKSQPVEDALLDDVRNAIDENGLVATSVRLGVSIVTLQKIMAGGLVRPQTRLRIVEGLKRPKPSTAPPGHCPVCGEPSEPHSDKPECQLCRLLDETLPVYLQSREARARVRRHLTEAQRKKAA